MKFFKEPLNSQIIRDALNTNSPLPVSIRENNQWLCLFGERQPMTRNERNDYIQRLRISNVDEYLDAWEIKKSTIINPLSDAFKEELKARCQPN